MENVGANSGDIVYVLTNEAMPNLIKIGKTSGESVERRLAELNRATGVPLPFNVAVARRVADAFALENALHLAFAPQRINPRREFFEVELGQVLAIINVFPGTDITPQVENAVEQQAQADDPGALEAEQRYAERRPPMNFAEMGIPPGSVLHCTIREATVTVVNDRQVSIGGQVLFLTPAHRLVTGYLTQPSPFWKFEGRLLRDIYNETYPRPD